MRHLAALSALAIVGSTLGTGLAGCKDSEGVDPPADATSQADGQADAKQGDATIDAARDATPPPKTVDTDPLHVAACESLASRDRTSPSPAG